MYAFVYVGGVTQHRTIPHLPSLPLGEIAVGYKQNAFQSLGDEEVDMYVSEVIGYLQAPALEVEFTKSSLEINLKITYLTQAGETA
jgi:hypothetical protein